MRRPNGEVVAWCHYLHPPQRIPLDLVSCNEFHDANVPTKYDMEKIAWDLRTDKSGKILGFAPPAREKE